MYRIQNFNTKIMLSKIENPLKIGEETNIISTCYAVTPLIQLFVFKEAKHK